MAFVDEVKIYTRSGKGGDGVVRWRQEKYIDKGGPSGGNGGNGGSVYAVGVRDVHLLSKYRTQKKFLAENGGPGGKKSLEGKNGEDLDIPLPIGSRIKNLATGEEYRLDTEGERILLLQGARGGYGNEHFKSSTNVTPKEWTPGKPAEEAEFYVEVELVADVGLIGLPNAGKSSLLNALTRATARIGDYPFTTLEPNLGECYGYILSDIPGLIEGAGSGKGLGHKFLRHVRRTNILLHLISVENEDLLDVYTSINKELEAFDPELLKKKEIIVISKTDLCTKEELLKSITVFKDQGHEVWTVSIHDEKSVKQLRDTLLQTLKEIDSKGDE